MSVFDDNRQTTKFGSWLNPDVPSRISRLLSSKLTDIFGNIDFIENIGLWRYKGNHVNLDTIALLSRDGKIPKGIIVPRTESITKQALDFNKTLCLNLWDDVDISTPRHLMVVRNCGWERVYFLPLRSGRRWLGSVLLVTAREEHVRSSILERLQLQCDHYATYADCVLAHSELHVLRRKLTLAYGSTISSEPDLIAHHHALPLPHPVPAGVAPGTEEPQIIGDSPAAKQVLEKIRVVSTTSASVLLLGETGTGKELLAKKLHFTSTRSSGPFVAVNCAAIPSGLVESEMFGHERGAFTGALSSRIGYFEQANGGTLFLDEIGDIPLEMQAKLLRVLQEQTIQRLGGAKKIKVDVRIVAATHRDLGAMIANERFREDLFYRLSVFPISVPPLRERREDIPLLVRHFTDKFCRQLRRPGLRVKSEDVKALVACEWRGNIRELENFVERAVICSSGGDLEIGELLKRPLSTGVDVQSAGTRTWEVIERDTIITALRATNGKIAGENGAARLLGLKRTTLNSKMSRLGIKIADIQKELLS